MNDNYAQPNGCPAADGTSPMYDDCMQDYDVIICPVAAFAALPHGESLEDRNQPGMSYTGTYNITGWPSTVVRGGTSPEGLPIGVQAVARPWREDVSLAVAQYLEGVTGGWQRPPI